MSTAVDQTRDPYKGLAAFDATGIRPPTSDNSD